MDHESRSCFVSYVNFDDDKGGQVPILRPILNNGEVIIAEAFNVFLLNAINDRQADLVGSLFVTNFRLSFQPNDSGETCRKSDVFLRFRDEFDVCLSMIDFIYVVDDKKKRLAPRHNIKDRVPKIIILCKNMRRLTFNFSLSLIDQGKQVANALLHHAYPIKHELLFAYDFQCPLADIDGETKLFRSATDWINELKRTKCRNWRVTKINENFCISRKMPEFFVVPATLHDFYLGEIVNHFSDQFLPAWCWGNKIGVALVRITETVQTMNDRTHENVVLEHIRNSHNWKVEPNIFAVNDDMLSVRNIRHKFLKFRKLMSPKSCNQFWSQDNNFFSLLDHSDWLRIVSVCLKKTVDIIELISNNITVVLQEKNGKDISCIISSLMQIIWDPNWRTIHGFQSLIQKEWITLSYPFSTRLGHIFSKDDEKSPILLLFFDCVWQLMEQNPFAFEFSENYLTLLWDYAHLTIFETFLFDSEYERFLAVENQGLKLRSLWQWIADYPDKNQLKNVLYDAERGRQKLEAKFQLYNLGIWQQNYYRWMPLLKPVTENRHFNQMLIRQLMEDVEKMESTIRQSPDATGLGHSSKVTTL